MRALVFSAGGAFGAYQAGVWQALEERGFQPDIVVGASIGAVNATAVARGATGRRLQQLWRDPRSNVFRRPRGPLLESRLQDVLREFPASAARARLLVTLTRLPSTRIQVVREDEVALPVLLASCAIPLLYAPVRWDGHWYCDGGVFCRLPLQVAAEATEIVAVDLLAAPPSLLLRGLLTAASNVRRIILREPDLMAAPKQIQVWRVEPAEPLGRLRDIMRWDPATIDRWIDAGYRDAAAVWDRARHTSPAHASNPTIERTAPT